MDTETPITERKAHKGLLREELLLLRHTFSLNFGRSQENFDRACAKAGGENLPGSTIKDLLIVSVDIESPPSQVGKAITHCQVAWTHIWSHMHRYSYRRIYDLKISVKADRIVIAIMKVVGRFVAIEGVGKGIVPKPNELDLFASDGTWKPFDYWIIVVHLISLNKSFNTLSVLRRLISQMLSP
jgi:hypothetical protein